MSKAIGIIGQRYQQAINPVVEHRFGTFNLFLERFGRLTDNEVVPVIIGNVFDPGNNCRHKITIKPRHNYTNRICSLIPEITGKVIGTITHLLGEISNLFFLFSCLQQGHPSKLC